MNQLKTIALLLWCTLMFVGAQANVTIEGSAPGYEGEQVKFLRYSNYLTKSLEVIDKTQVADDATFAVQFDAERIFEVWVEIDNVRGMLYVQPNGYYKIIFPELGQDEIASMGKTTTTELYFEEMNDGDINMLVFDFNDIYDIFFISYDTILAQARRGVNPDYQPWQRDGVNVDNENERDTIKTRVINLNYVQAVVDTFRNFLVERYTGIEPTGFFENHVRYIIAELEASTFANGNYLFDNYIRNQKPLHHNMAYMDFVQDYFESYLEIESFGRRGNELRDILLYGNSLDQLIDFMANDTITATRELQELVAIQGLYELFYHEDFSQQKLLYFLTAISEEGTAENEALANIVIHELTYLKPGYPAPDFTLTTLDGDSVSLSDYRGKWVYIGFWASWCKPCLAEMEAMPDMHKKYKKYIEFLSISVDATLNEMIAGASVLNDIKWPMLYAGPNSDVAEAYNVLSAPEYIMVDPDGNIMQAPAYKPTPDGNYISIDKTFHEIYWGNK